jgi:hypothetical protein
VDIAPVGQVPLKKFLLAAWIMEQRRYYETSSERNRRRHRLLSGAVVIAFLLTLGAAILHVFQVGDATGAVSAEHGWIFLSIVLPALATAITGITAQFEYARNAERYRETAGTLRLIEDEIERTSSMGAIRSLLHAADQRLLFELRDWVDTMRFQELHLHP